MPRKVFVAGEILTAADVNTNLMDQAVMTFAGTAARGSAIGTAVEGMVTYLEDTDQLEVYDGSDWLSASNFLFGTATPTEGQVATFSTAVSGYVPADAPSGKVLQVVSATDSTPLNTTSTSYQDTGLSVSITPSSSSNKIVVIVSQDVRAYGTVVDISGAQALLRDSTILTENQIRLKTNSTTGEIVTTQHFSPSYLDSPSTTSAVTYKTQIKAFASSSTIGTENFGPSSIVVMEIAG